MRHTLLQKKCLCSINLPHNFCCFIDEVAVAENRLDVARLMNSHASGLRNKTRASHFQPDERLIQFPSSTANSIFSTNTSLRLFSIANDGSINARPTSLTISATAQLLYLVALREQPCTELSFESFSRYFKFVSPFICLQDGRSSEVKRLDFW